MPEPILEQIAVWIAETIDGQQDPGKTLTLRAVRPELLEWEVGKYHHGDVIIEAVKGDTQGKTTSSRTEVAQWLAHGVIKNVPAGTAVDTVLARMAETIRKLLLAGNSSGQACAGMAHNIDCPSTVYVIIDGGVVAAVTVKVKYKTAVDDGYS